MELFRGCFQVKKKVSVYLPEKFLRKLDKLAKKRGLTRNSLITVALEEYVRRIEKEFQKKNSLPIGEIISPISL